MHHNLIKEIIGLDKKSREKIADLIKKKENIDSDIKKETKKIEQDHLIEVKQSITSTKQKLEALVKEKQEKEFREYETILKDIKKQYSLSKDNWIKEISNACKK